MMKRLIQACKLLILLAIAIPVLAAPITLNVKYKTITVNGKTKKVATIEQPNGTWGLYLNAGNSFNVKVKNNLTDATIIHWHGMILPNNQDGVAGVTQPFPIAPSLTYSYQFPLVQTGTYWMHSHEGLQEQDLIEAPLIIQTQDDQNYQQVIVMSQDFSFKSSQEIFDNLRHKNSTSMANMDMDADKTQSPDLNDVQYDAYLINYHSPDAPPITRVQAGKTVKLRFINGSAATNYWIDLGRLDGTLVAVDGQDVSAFTDKKFQLAMGQRLDIKVTIPQQGGTFVILEQVEGLKDQTGFILTTSKHPVPNRINSTANKIAPALDYQQEFRLRSKTPTPMFIGHTSQLNITLTGNMDAYQWKINNEMWPNVTPLQVTTGQHIIMKIQNNSMMAHPMHLHGYDFKVTNINGKPIDGAWRDTILVLPHSYVTVEFYANHIGKWLLHCHMLYHMNAGMMTYLNVVP